MIRRKFIVEPYQKIMKKVVYFFFFFAVNLSFAQDYSSVVNSYLQNNRSEFALESQDISDVSIVSQSFSKSLKAENVYVEQRYQGIKVFNSSSPFVIKDGQVVSAKVSFVDNLAAKVNVTSPSVSAVQAVSKAAAALGLEAPSNLNLLETVANNSYIFSNGSISMENIPVQLVYQTNENTSSLKLAWDLSIYLLDASHYYSVRIDAVTGELIATDDWVVSCAMGETAHSHNNGTSILASQYTRPDAVEIAAAGPSYRVFPVPVESPTHGSDELVLDPADPTASPFGWHDNDGVPGAEFTYTRGNNVIAQDDVNGNNGAGSRPDGGADLEFDFPFGLPQPPANYLDAAITNLFYMNNMIHDITYHYGFDEASGNFQINNYGNGGNGGDYVFADAQDGGGINNANFSTPPDGGAGRMQMYLWSAPGQVLGTFMTVNGGAFDGQYYAKAANFVLGTALPNTPITSDLVLIEDDDSGASTDPNDGCDNIINAAEIAGKIAIVRSGTCSDRSKVVLAEAAGAIAVIVVNDTPLDPNAMLGAGPAIGIPAIKIYQEDGEPMIDALINGETINATLRDDGSGFDGMMRDGDLDNGIVLHEYGHGVSNRLTGGRLNASCLQNQEQMGEGWSDYLALMLTMRPGDTKDDPRGIGTYVEGEGIRGIGIRTKAYSPDFAINDFTYDDIKTQTVPHGVGSVWTTMLWDLTWDLIEVHGYDPDIYNGTGGNNIALQLVMDGMKLQVCSPGFVDGRDAILEADELAYGGANRCVIWYAFAKRGLGLSASQGSSSSRGDGTEAFDVPADCELGAEDHGSVENNFIVFPNPSNGEINIKARIDLGDVTVSIFDMNGRRVFSQEYALHNTANINANGLGAGIYLMQIDGDNYSQTTKLIIN